MEGKVKPEVGGRTLLEGVDRRGLARVDPLLRAWRANREIGNLS